MDFETAKEVALFKYSIIAPVNNGMITDQMSKEAYYRMAAQKTYTYPDGRSRTFTASTIKSWYLDYHAGGLNALIPKSSADAGKSRSMTDEVCKQINAYREKFPRITGQKIYEKLQEDGYIRYGETSVDSVWRYLRSHDMKPEAPSQQECLAFEFEHANDCWQADTVDGPYIKPDGAAAAKKTYLITFIDDASRMHTHGEFFFEDNQDNAMSVLKKAIQKCGVPKMLLLDNGSPYKNKAMSWTCGLLGIHLIYCRPGQPKGKGKEERSHRTHDMRFLTCTDFHGCRSLDDLNQKFWVYLEKDYNLKIHSSISCKPRERYMKDYDRFKFVDTKELNSSFLFCVERGVSKTATVRLKNLEYEVPQKYVGQKVYVRYDPKDLSTIYLYDIVNKKDLLETISLLNKHDNRKRKRKNICYEQVPEEKNGGKN